MKSRCAFDSLAIREGRLFGWGWYLSPRAPVERIELHIVQVDGRIARLPCLRSGSRPDLAEAYPEVPHALGGGFLVQGRIPIDAVAERAELRAKLTDGSEEFLPIHGFPRHFAKVGRIGTWTGKRVIAGRLLALRRFQTLSKRVGAMLTRRLSSLREWLKAIRDRNGSDSGLEVVVIFDHAMGGGANHFRDELIAKLLNGNRDVVLMTPHLQTLQYEIVRRSRTERRTSRHDSLSTALAAIGHASFVVVNDLVSYDDPLLILDWIARKKAEGARSCFYLHDYFPVCPVWTLIGRNGRYCGLPDYSECIQCLAENSSPFLTLLPECDLPAWRSVWKQFLIEADEIVAFSTASVKILTAAFPILNASSIAVRPHSLAYLPDRRARPEFGPEVVIAVVGTINVYKGAEIVAEMADLIEAKRIPAKIVVIGTIDNVVPSRVLRILGPYSPEQLPDLLTESKASVCFLPSIWHETFSYVASELMHYGMPLAVFDLGAPAERVRDYRMGCVISRVDAAMALDALLSLHRRSAGFEIADPDQNGDTE